MVDGFAGRSVAERFAFVGTMGRFPLIMRPPLNACWLTAVGVTRPVPKRSEGTVEMAWRMRWLSICRRLEKPLPPCSGGMPPFTLLMFVMLVMFVTFTVLKCEPHRPYHG